MEDTAEDLYVANEFLGLKIEIFLCRLIVVTKNCLYIIALILYKLLFDKLRIMKIALKYILRKENLFVSIIYYLRIFYLSFFLRLNFDFIVIVF